MTGPTITCPLCGGRADVQVGLCECGWDAGHAFALERARSRWLTRRNLVGGLAMGCVGLANLGRALSWELLEIIGAALVVPSLFFMGLAILRMRTLRSQLRAARQPKALPKAQLV